MKGDTKNIHNSIAPNKSIVTRKIQMLTKWNMEQKLADYLVNFCHNTVTIKVIKGQQKNRTLNNKQNLMQRKQICIQ